MQRTYTVNMVHEISSGLVKFSRFQSLDWGVAFQRAMAEAGDDSALHVDFDGELFSTPNPLTNEEREAFSVGEVPDGWAEVEDDELSIAEDAQIGNPLRRVA